MSRKKSIVIYILSLVIIMFSFSSCSRGEYPTTAFGFEAPLEKSGYTVDDVTDTVETGGLATVVLKAYGMGDTLVFHETNSDDDGKKLYDMYYETAVADNPDLTVIEEVQDEEKCYNYFAFSDGEMVYVISRIKNTLICGYATEENREIVLDSIEHQGY